VSVPWGLEEPKKARVVEVWGDPPVHVRIQLEPEGGDDLDEPVVILVSPSVLNAA
jgi:hypothetical protein